MEKRAKLRVDDWTTARIGVPLYMGQPNCTFWQNGKLGSTSRRCTSRNQADGKLEAYTCWLLFVYFKPMKAKSLKAQPMKDNAKIPVYQKLSSPGRISCARL